LVVIHYSTSAPLAGTIFGMALVDVFVMVGNADADEVLKDMLRSFPVSLGNIFALAFFFIASSVLENLLADVCISQVMLNKVCLGIKDFLGTGYEPGDSVKGI
jgi:hypothetical protein